MVTDSFHKGLRLHSCMGRSVSQAIDDEAPEEVIAQAVCVGSVQRFATALQHQELGLRRAWRGEYVAKPVSSASRSC